MAQTNAAAAALEALASEIEVAASWHSGPRYQRLMTMAEQARGIADGSIGAEEITAYTNATTAAPPFVEDPSGLDGDRSDTT